jgi:hypothetical protein
MTTPQQPAYRSPNTSQLPAIDRLAFAAVLESPPPLHALANFAEPTGGKLSLSVIKIIIIRDSFSDIGPRLDEALPIISPLSLPNLLRSLRPHVTTATRAMTVQFARHVWANFGAHGTDSGKDTTTGVSADELGAYLSTNVGTKQRTEQSNGEQLIDGRAIHSSPILRTAKTASDVVDIVEIAPRCATKEQSVPP